MSIADVPPHRIRAVAQVLAQALAQPLAQAFALTVLACASAHADPSDYVFVPYTEAGRLQLAWSAGTQRERDGGSARGQTLTLGYAPTDRYSTQAYASWAADPGESLRYDEFAWLNQFMLTSPGAGALDVGALCGIEKPHERDEGDEILCGALFEWDSDHVQFNFNPLLERSYHGTGPSQTDLLYQWQAKTLVGRGLELGAQGFGELGPWTHWAPASQQEHSLGPAVFAKWRQGDGRMLSLDAAWLFGLGSGSPRDTLRVRVQELF